MIEFVPYWLQGIVPKVIAALWFIFPAYVANASPTLMGGRRPMDFGRSLFDKRRVLGDGKTWEGFFGGIFVGTLFGVVMMAYQPLISPMALRYGIVLKDLSIPILLALTVGTLVGDASGSFVKRRFNLHRGVPAPLLDQLSFIIGALYLASYFTHVTSETIVILLLVTPGIHWFSCIIGYIIGVKKNPW